MADYLDFEKIDYLDDEILVYEKRVYDIGRCIKFPFEDVAPVIHAHWIVNMFPAHEHVECSHCKEQYYENDLYLGGNDFPKYCPNCGAKMDEVIE